jgi:hypothetical protein
VVIRGLIRSQCGECSHSQIASGPVRIWAVEVALREMLSTNIRKILEKYWLARLTSNASKVEGSLSVCPVMQPHVQRSGIR